MTLAGSLDEILGYFMVPTLAFLAMGTHRNLRPSSSLAPAVAAERALRVPGYPVTVLLALVPILIVIVLQTLRIPGLVAFGLGVVALGVPISMLVLAKRPAAGEDVLLKIVSSGFPA